MPYVTSIEQLGIEKGREQGREDERRSLALKMLQKNLPLEMIADITGVTVVQLQQLQVQENQD